MDLTLIWYKCWKERLWTEIRMSSLKILQSYWTQRRFFKRLLSFHYWCLSISKESEGHGRESCFLVLPVLERLCSQKLLRQWAKQHFSMFLPQVWLQNGEESLRNLSEFCLRWQDSMGHQQYLLMKSTLLLPKEAKMSMKAQRKLKQRCSSRWTELTPNLKKQPMDLPRTSWC